MLGTEALFALDLVSTVAMGAVAAAFVLLWRRTGAPLHLLVAVGFGLLAASYGAVTRSEFDPSVNSRWDAIRLSGQVGGALVLLLAYAHARLRGHPRVPLVLGWAVGGGAAASLLAGAVAGSPLDGVVFAVAYVVMTAAWAACAVLVLLASSQGPRTGRGWVPAGFAALMLSKYTWLLIYLGAGDPAVAFVFVWRFVAIACLLVGVWPAFRRGADAAA